ncbi:MAG: C25 family cysteine peptidase, partial [candidate division WOR-3 bacterium]|nr:C25 family cysteine peptidase [candidate division WOR-3 bacterium]
MQRLVVLLVSASLLYGGEEDSTPVTRWVGPEGSRPGTYQEWIAQNPVNESCRYVVLDTVISNGDAPWVAIYTDSVYDDSLRDDLNVLSNHLGDDGFSVRRWSVRHDVHPETLRNRIRADWEQYGIKGALFVGNIPTAWFQVSNDLDSSGYAAWPCDLFYMDLDGEWRDTIRHDSSWHAGIDSIYDLHEGAVAPEIYVGRLMPTGLDSQLTQLRRYFRKDNAFRLDTLRLPSKALFFIDDSWVRESGHWSEELAVAYSDTEKYDDDSVTTATVYREKLDTARAWVSVFAHGHPQGQHFSVPGGPGDYYWANEYTSQDPPANFYNHFTCSFCRYTETLSACGGVTSVFNKNHGLCAIGSTKPGGMLEFGEFYQPMAEGKTIGQAYLEWFNFIAVDGFTHAELLWHYGMTLLGDPFLRPVLQADVCPTAVICPERYYAQCETIVPQVRVWNAGKGNASFAVTCSMRLNCQSYYASLESVSGLAAGAKETVDLDPVFLESGCYTVRVRTTMSGDENPLNDTFVSSVTVGDTGWKEVTS